MPKPKTTRKKSRPKTSPNQPALLPADNGGATSKARLSSVIKSARDIMRKDAGLNGDLDRLPQLSWILFLKCFDDLEQRRAAEAVMAGQKYQPVIPAPFRWRDWAADPDRGSTGPDLLDFVNNNLLSKLRGLTGSDERQVIAEVFGETYNRMLSGYLLRDVVNLVNQINFNSSDDIFTLGHLYESMLKEMRDAAGDSGEFYTPRPVVRFIVDRVAPKIGEKVLDPAAGTGGFLVECYEFMRQQQRTAADRRALQSGALSGVEKKPMPYLLGMMNLLLHGLERPNLKRDNALKNPLIEIGPKDRFDVIVTNPPFGGEEERGIQLNFPEATRTHETALLFLQFIMRTLKSGGRCGMVLPNGTPLSGDGVPMQVRKQLVNEFNLHTIVRLAPGTFAPYTNLEANLLFFDKTTSTTDVWYYEMPLPAGRKVYTKTRPMLFEEFQACVDWWDNRRPTPCAWKVSVDELAASAYDFERRNPNGADEHLPSLRKVMTSISSSGDAIGTRIHTMQALLPRSLMLDTEPDSYRLSQGYSKWPLRTIIHAGIQVNNESRNPVRDSPTEDFFYIDLGTVNHGVIGTPKKIQGINAPSRARRVMHSGDVLFSTVRPYLNGHAVVPAEFDNQICSTGFAVLSCPDEIVPEFLLLALMSPYVIWQCRAAMRGGHYPAMKDDKIKKLLIPIPPRGEQERMISAIYSLQSQLSEYRKQIDAFNQALSASLDSIAPALFGKVYRGDVGTEDALEFDPRSPRGRP